MIKVSNRKHLIIKIEGKTQNILFVLLLRTLNINITELVKC